VFIFEHLIINDLSADDCSFRNMIRFTVGKNNALTQFWTI